MPTPESDSSLLHEVEAAEHGARAWADVPASTSVALREVLVAKVDVLDRHLDAAEADQAAEELGDGRARDLLLLRAAQRAHLLHRAADVLLLRALDRLLRHRVVAPLAEQHVHALELHLDVPLAPHQDGAQRDRDDAAAHRDELDREREEHARRQALEQVGDLRRVQARILREEGPVLPHARATDVRLSGGRRWRPASAL